MFMFSFVFSAGFGTAVGRPQKALYISIPFVLVCTVGVFMTLIVQRGLADTIFGTTIIEKQISSILNCAHI